MPFSEDLQPQWLSVNEGTVTTNYLSLTVMKFGTSFPDNSKTLRSLMSCSKVPFICSCFRSKLSSTGLAIHPWNNSKIKLQISICFCWLPVVHSNFVWLPFWQTSYFHIWLLKRHFGFGFSRAFFSNLLGLLVDFYCVVTQKIVCNFSSVDSYCYKKKEIFLV